MQISNTIDKLEDDRKMKRARYMAEERGGGKRRSGKKRKASAKFLAAGNAWRSHLSEYRKKNPNLSLKQQMKGASKTYKKGKSKSGSVSVKTSKYSVHVRPRRSRRTKRSKRSKRSKGSRRKKRRSRKKRSRGLFF